MSVSTSHSICLPILFFFNYKAPTEIYTLSLHDALPICSRIALASSAASIDSAPERIASTKSPGVVTSRSEEHTSELQSLRHLVCRLLLEKKKKKTKQRKQHARHTHKHNHLT